MDNQNQTPEQQVAKEELLSTLREVATGGGIITGQEQMQAALLIAKLEDVLRIADFLEMARVVNGPNPKK